MDKIAGPVLVKICRIGLGGDLHTQIAIRFAGLAADKFYKIAFGLKFAILDLDNLRTPSLESFFSCCDFFIIVFLSLFFVCLPQAGVAHSHYSLLLRGCVSYVGCPPVESHAVV